MKYLILIELRQDCPAIKFNKNHWKKIPGIGKNEKIDSSYSCNNNSNSNNKLENFND
jgi:hypothetical protein